MAGWAGEDRVGEGAALRKGGAARSRLPGWSPTPKPSRRRPLGRRPRAAFRVAAALCLTVILGGCGIEEYVYFYKPIVASDPVLSVTPLSFSHNTSNSSSSFWGYDIYYMLVDADNTDIVGKCATLDSYISGSSQTPSQIIALMKSYGFKSLIGLDGSGNLATSQPLFSIEPSGLGKDIDFTISINDQGTVQITGEGASYVNAPATVRRNSFNVNTGKYRDFSNLTVNDIGSGGDTAYKTSSPSTVLFRAYIFGYGMTSSFSDVFSYPARVGAGTSSVQITGSFEN